MKKKILLRFFIIGLLHTFVYIWFIPFIVYPKFGSNGFMCTIFIAVTISISIFGTLFLKKKENIN